MKNTISIPYPLSQTPPRALLAYGVECGNWERNIFKITFIFLILISCVSTFAQVRDINSLLDQTLRNRGLTREDISIPIEFFSTAEKSPTKDVKLILPLVKDMMINPMRSITWLDSVSELGNYTVKTELIKLLTLVVRSNENNVRDDTLFMDGILFSRDYDSWLNDLIWIVNHNKKQNNEILLNYNEQERLFLSKNLLSIFEESEDNNSIDKDILKYNIQRDSSIVISKNTMDLLSRINLEKIREYSFHAFFSCFAYYDYRMDQFKNFKNKYLETINNKYVQGDFYYYSDENGIRIAIGGPGKNIYTGKFDFIIDLGGDDIYNIDRPPLNNVGGLPEGFSCIIDLAGNDYYTTSSDFALAGGLFSSSFIFDKEGDDFYESKGSGNLGAAIGGLGLLYDEKGNDTYKGISFSIGAGCFGVGLLVDREGNDFYIANSYSQGFGMTLGVGAIIDNKGNDSYLVDSRSLDIGRYNDHYVSMCQGYGLGLRPFYAGGIGLIIEGEGNDIYNTDIFGQGGGYWYSLGAIVDKSGHDKYNGYQYSQGAGIHLAIGLLKDYDGWDFYQSNGVSQGCGHDFGVGMLWDAKGNDNYSANSLSQGAGNADGIGILIDESGTDGYLNKFPANTRGYGNPRREYGSIGVFLDASGTDYYSQPGYDSTFINSSNWGVFTDYDFKDLPEQVSGDNFKVPLDSVPIPIRGNNIHRTFYTIEDYFAMAKTIEPRFSLWQDYGFRKLIEDSTNTAKYILTKFGTTDHRDVQVFRVLALKIQWSIAQVLLERLKAYSVGQALITQAELSMICYIFGETKDPSAKDYLLELTKDENYRVRSSAINALGKINYDKSDKDFIDKVTQRLGELAAEKSEKKIYNKDIAFAVGNYISPNGLDILLGMLDNSYYGARFVAAENLKKFPELLNIITSNNSIPTFFMEEKPFVAFMQSLTTLTSNDFKIIFTFLKVSPIYENESVIYNLINLLKYKIDNSDDKGIDVWYQNQLDELQIKVPLKIR